MPEVLLDALIDSAIALPFLLIIYLFIEFLEGNARAKTKTVKLLNGKLAPLVAGGVGLVPQCGFSVMATDLYCQNYIKLGTLVAFFVATSDEALPILLTNAQTVGVVWIVLAVKVVYAVLFGYLINLLDRRKNAATYTLAEAYGCCHHELYGKDADGCDHDGSAPEDSTPQCDADACEQAAETINRDTHTAAEQSQHNHTHALSPAQKFWQFVKHPILHTLKIFAYILLVNIVFGLLLFYFEDAILNFTSRLGFAQCFIVALLGLVPNCASSVIISGMYADGIITLSAMISGLVANSGIALAILFRERKWKRNLAILGILYLAAVVAGVSLYFIFPPFNLL